MVEETRIYAEPSGAILVADDASEMRHACKRALEKVGHRVVLAKNGDEAVAAARSERIDVALLDIRMPGPSGIEVLKAIKRERPLVEVVIMTGFATQDVAEEAVRLGAAGFLTKPFANVKILTDAVSQAVIRKRLNEEGFHGKVKIEDLLLKEGIINVRRAEEAKAKAIEWNVSIGDALVRMGAVQPEDLDWVVAKSLDISFVRLKEIRDVDEAATKQIPARVAKLHRLIPLLVEGGKIHVAVDDPFDREGLEDVSRRTGLTPVIVKGFGPEIDSMIRHFYPEERSDIEGRIDALASRPDRESLLDVIESSGQLKINAVKFDPVGGEGRKSWIFRIEGIVEEKGNKGEDS